MERLDAWLREYGRAWEDRDADAAVALFSEGAEYHETPFDEPMRGRDAVRSYWAELPGAQRDVTFRWEVLADDADVGVARWQAEFTRIPSGVRVWLDGVCTVRFDDEGRCREFREWWHRTESQPPG